MQLLKLVQNQVRVDEPLPWNIRDASGQLLLAKGFVLHGQQQLEALLDRGVYVDIEEVRAARRAAEEAAARAPNLFGQWERLLWRLDKLLRHIGQEADFSGEAGGPRRRHRDLPRGAPGPEALPALRPHPRDPHRDHLPADDAAHRLARAAGACAHPGGACRSRLRSTLPARF